MSRLEEASPGTLLVAADKDEVELDTTPLAATEATAVVDGASTGTREDGKSCVEIGSDDVEEDGNVAEDDGKVAEADDVEEEEDEDGTDEEDGADVAGGKEVEDGTEDDGNDGGDSWLGGCCDGNGAIR